MMMALNMKLTKIGLMMALKMKLTTIERKASNEGTNGAARRDTCRIEVEGEDVVGHEGRERRK